MAVDLDLADPRSARQLPRGRGANECHVNSLPKSRLCHGPRLTTHPAAHIVRIDDWRSVELLVAYPA
jgi:hypothetical protein